MDPPWEPPCSQKQMNGGWRRQPATIHVAARSRSCCTAARLSLQSLKQAVVNGTGHRRSMRIQSIRIENYKSLPDSGEIRFTPGINLIVGKNNSGKSALLEAISLNFGPQPHLSLAALPTPDTPINPTSSVTVTLTFSGGELGRLLLAQNPGMQFKFGWPALIQPPNADSRAAAINAIMAESDLRATATRAASQAHTNWEQRVSPGLSGYAVATHGNQQIGFNAHPSNDRSHFEFVGNPQAEDLRGDVGTAAVSLFATRIYVFEAERRGSAPCSNNWNSVLNQNADNLADVLLTLSQNPVKWAEYQDLIRQVFPEIEGFSTRRNQSGLMEVRIWVAPLSSKREDLTVSLAECGSGIAQVLAIVYVVMYSTLPQVIAVDEPNSFLHPDASRALIRILKQFPAHQYIVTTHSPEVIAESGAANLLVMKHSDGKSEIREYPGAQLKDLREALISTGARLSDVFGYDRVLWVEGPSDAAVLSWLIARVDPLGHDIAVCPVRSTGDFEPPSIEQAVEIYQRLSHANALIPATIAFLFDRELRSEKTIEAAERRKDPPVRFLMRRMMENYFLDPRVVAATLASLSPPLEKAPTAEAIEKWFDAYATTAETNWRLPLACHGKRLLKAVFTEFSSATHLYREVEHLPALARKQIDIDRAPLVELATILARLGALREREFAMFSAGQ